MKGDVLMGFEKMFSKIFYKEVSKYVDQRAKQKKKDREINKIHTEKHRQNQKIHDEKVRIFQDKIDIADDYLQKEVNILNEFKKNEAMIERFFTKNHWLKSVQQRSPRANFSLITLTTYQREDLLKKLQLTPRLYVQQDLYSLGKPTRDTTLEFIILNTPTIKKLSALQDLKGYRLYITTHIASSKQGTRTICFGLLIKDDAKQPF